MKSKTKSILSLILVIFLFLSISFAVEGDIANLDKYIGGGYLGMIIYVIIAIFATVFAPVSSVPLLPLISDLYGWFIAGLLSIIGWTIGSLIAFWLSRKYGMPLVKKIVSLEKISEFEKKVPRENLFWSIVFLRMVVPVDVLSYVLGLFTHIKFRTYFWATLIGVTPFAFILAYVGILSFYYQVSFILMGTLILLIGYKIHNFRKLSDS